LSGLEWSSERSPRRNLVAVGRVVAWTVVWSGGVSSVVIQRGRVQQLLDRLMVIVVNCGREVVVVEPCGQSLSRWEVVEKSSNTAGSRNVVELSLEVVEIVRKKRR
jgi:hypothetical protein